jgi:superfamily II DNA or RNA helicase
LKRHRKEEIVSPPDSIAQYLRDHALGLGSRILESFPPLHAIDDPPSPMISKLLRRPYPAQTLAMMGLVRRWQQARAGAVIAECGTGKTLISLAAVYTHAEGRPFTALAMVPPQLVEKWCRETFLKDRDFLLLTNWGAISTSRWSLSYREDDRNWRLWNPNA